MIRALGLLSLLAVLIAAVNVQELADGSVTMPKLGADVVAAIDGAGLDTGFGSDPDFIADTLYVWMPLRNFFATGGASLTSYGSSQFEILKFLDESTGYAYATLTFPEGAAGPRTTGLEVTLLCSIGSGTAGGVHDMTCRLLGRGQNEFIGLGNYTDITQAVATGTVNSRFWATTFDFTSSNILASSDFQLHIRLQEGFTGDTGTADTWVSGVSFKIW